MRLFTGISLAPNVAERLSEVLSELKPTACINWSPVGNLHITCRFIGAWPEDRLPELMTSLAAIPAGGPISITVSQFGYFPNPHRPHSLFAGVQEGPELRDLAAAMGSQEDREFHPHVTLARIKGTTDLKVLRERIAAMNDFNFGTFEAHEFHLYSSVPTPGGSVYTKLASYDLMREKRTNS